MMSTIASITWSNSHQRIFDEILSKALRDGYLEITNAREFSLREEFFHENTSKEFLAHIPRELLDKMVSAWIRKQLCKGEVTPVSNDKSKPIDLNSARVQKVALKVFLRICRKWQLDEGQIKILLNADSSFQLDAENPQISDQTLERISYICGIYKNLRIIFPTERQTNEWIKKPNAAFDGNTALQAMITDPSVVRRYLDAQVHS